MEKLLTPDDVAGILQISNRTAYKIMHQIPHMERPFRVSEAGLRAWINGNTHTAQDKPKKHQPMQMPMMTDFHIPRKRAEV